MFGGIELGGTKTVIGIGDGGGRVLDRAQLPTTSPVETLGVAVAGLAALADRHGPLQGIGVAAFGPVDLGEGRMLATPKPGWSGADLAGPLRAPGCPLAFATDVGGAGIAEAALGALADVPVGLYLTVGTGIGGALIVDGAPVDGLMHPEMGHLPVVRQADDGFAGCCPFHGACLEGMASGTAIRARFGRPLGEFPAHGPERRMIADYLGQALAMLVLVVSPARIVVGGGVMHTPGLRAAAADAMRRHLAGYVPAAALSAADYVVAPALGDDAGLIGALLLAGRG